MIIEEPGIYQIDAEQYHADPCPRPSLSGSVAIPLVHRSPLHAWIKHPRLNADVEPFNSDRLSFGSAAHSMLLGAGNPVKFLAYDDYRKKAAQEERDQALSDGYTPLLEKDSGRLRKMMDVAPSYLALCGVALRTGKPEQTLVWREGNEWCRGMVDWLSDDLRTVFDYKTTGLSANPRDMGRSLFDNDYHLKAAFYERGLNVLDPDPRNIGRRRSVFLFQEITEPFACSLISVSEGGMTIGRKQATYAIETWQRCMATNVWPAYGVGVSVVSPPPWIEKAWLEREQEDEAMSGETSPDRYGGPHQLKHASV